MGFKDRTTKGDAYFKTIDQFFSSHGYIVVKTGIEEHYSRAHPDLLKLPQDLTSKYFRYHPDGFYIATKENKSVYFDAKASDFIEKDAYLIYQLMMTMGLNVLICIQNRRGQEFHVPMTALILISGKESIKPFKYKLPLDSDDWIAPRLLSKPEYLKWKEKNPMASGTPYQYFNFEAMKQYQLQKSKSNQSIKSVFDEEELELPPPKETK
jgi:hypothetical protein